MMRQCVEWVGEQTRCDQTFVCAIADTRPTITDMHMCNALLSTVQADDRPIVDSVSVV